MFLPSSQKKNILNGIIFFKKLKCHIFLEKIKKKKSVFNQIKHFYKSLIENEHIKGQTSYDYIIFKTMLNVRIGKL